MASRIKRNLQVSSLPLPNKYKNQLAFTLAEVLITLTILGIVAALVIPPIAQKSQYTQLKVAYKENYSIIGKAVQQAIQNNGGTFKGLAVGEGVIDSVAPYLNYVKRCHVNEPGQCWHLDNILKTLNMSSYWNWGRDASGLVLSNGAILIGANNEVNCGAWSDEICGNIGVDVNGFKGPNVVGRDVFFIYITATRVIPGGRPGDMWENDCVDNGITEGFGCGAKILLNQDY